MTHVLSARRFQHETYSDKGSPRSQYELNLTGRTDQQSFYRQSEKGGERSLETIDLGHGSQAIFDEVDLGLEPSKLTSMNCKESAQTITIPSRFNCVSKVNAISPERNFSINSVTTSYTPGSQGIDVISPPVFEPKMNDIQSNAIASQTTYISTDVVTSGQQGLIPRGEDIVRRASDTVPRDRLATLSFYDDLLKSINSERMIYASSLSNHVDLDVQQSIVDSNNLGLESGPQVKMSPETFFGYSNYDNPDSCEKPIHPFDVIPHSHSSTTLKFRHIETANMDVSDHSIGAPRGESINQFPYRKSQQSFTNGFYFSSLSRSESSNSQETIENWRIHVEPSSPGIPEFDYDMQKATANANNKTTHGIAEADCDFEADGALDQYEDSVSRRGTIPIILSSHLLEAKLDCQESQDGLFSVNDLHLPRPSYAYSQTRTQRQGSVNSSIGGYNYSAASSPSLADSLSNPMYQQSYGMMNGFHGPRNVPPRKCSLPISILSSGNDDSITRTSPLQYQTSQLQIPQHPACPTFSTRTKTRSPSHLSNMLYQSDCDISTKGNVDRSNRSEYEKPPSIQKKTHFRSQSFGTRSSVRQSASSWDQPEYFRDPQVGYASQMHLPPSSASYVYQGQDRDSFLESSTKMNLSSKMSLKEALAIDSPRNDYSSSSDRKSLYMAGGYYEGQSDTQFVHPLDLSPLLQQSQLRNQHEHHHNAFTHTTMNYGADSNSLQPEAWPEVYIGLGLTFNNNSYGQQTESNRNEYPFTGATASKYSLNQHDFNSSNNNFRGNYWDNPESRPELPTRNPTMTTDLSGETLTNYRQAITTEVHNDYENEILRHHKQQLNTTLVNQHLPQVDHKELSVIHRQPSQRNKKNLVVNIVPQNCS
ncbi:hypothetical protein BGZ46_000531 [Entomortierella lignicola]|nr:hypothetical protein BGZ46_000531 [Entomortierella lignicola]